MTSRAAIGDGHYHRPPRVPGTENLELAAVQLPVQLACSYRATSVSATPRLPIAELHACTRAARSATGIGSRCSQAKTHADDSPMQAGKLGSARREQLEGSFRFCNVELGTVKLSQLLL
jgi:hypothetical protein